MGWGIVSITRRGTLLGDAVRRHLGDARHYAPRRFGLGDEDIKGPFGAFVGRIMPRHEVLLFVMAAGIVVRALAPHLAGKTRDPGVVVMDEQGRHAVSLLAGHLGGANEAALVVSRITGATPVITTASDLQGLRAVDLLARDLDCAIDSMESAKRVTAIMVNGGAVGLVGEVPAALPAGFLGTGDGVDALVVIDRRPVGDPGIPWVHLVPRRVAAGVGCRRGCGAAAIMAAIRQALDEAGRDRRALAVIASIDVKADEEGLVAASRELGVPLRFYSAPAISAAGGDDNGSDFVRQAVGVGAVSVPCARLAAGPAGRLVAGKHAAGGITVALYEWD